MTVNGLVTTTLTSGASTGVAQVQATCGNATRVISVSIIPAQGYSITLSAADDRLLPNGASTAMLTAQMILQVRLMSSSTDVASLHQ